MRSLPYAVLIATALLLIGEAAGADDLPTRPQSLSPLIPAPKSRDLMPAQGQLTGNLNDQLAVLQKNVADLQIQLAVARADGLQDDDLKKQIELHLKKMETEQKMIDRLAEQIKKPATGPAVEKLQTQMATLEARTKQAAQRDQELRQAVDNISEHLDADERNGPRLPTTLNCCTSGCLSRNTR